MDNEYTEEKKNAENVLVSVINGAIKIPGVKVDRKSFLRDRFKNVSGDKLQKILQVGPVSAGCNREEIRKKARRLIKERAMLSGGASFVAGLPGGFAMAASIPADLIQFYGVALRLAQEIAYLYGEEDLWHDGTLDDEKVMNQLILYCGVMMGASGASQTVRLLSSSLAKQALKKLPQKALTKTFYYPIIKSIAKALGVKMTKEVFAKGVSKAVPIVGGVVSGGITLGSMIPMGNRLADALDKAHFDYSKNDFSTDWHDVISVVEDGDGEIIECEADSDSGNERKAAPTQGESAFDKISQAKVMLDEGIITEEEFAEIKQKIIAQM